MLTTFFKFGFVFLKIEISTLFTIHSAEAFFSIFVDAMVKMKTKSLRVNSPAKFHTVPNDCL